MVVTIQPSRISGTVEAPASKSSMQRACALALLSGATTELLHPGTSNDDLAALAIIQKLGARVTRDPVRNIIRIESEIPFPVHAGTEINCGESGLGARMFAPIVALSPEQVRITGSGSLLKRPISFYDEVFPQLGVSVQSTNGFLPVHIKGPLQPTDIVIDGSLSSQFLTGLLIAFGSAVTKPVTITVRDLKSRPYIDLTLEMMNLFGYDIQNHGYTKFTIHPKVNESSGLRYRVESDWSSASFLLVAGALAGSVTVKGLNLFSAQADKAMLQALMDCGTNMSVERDQVCVNEALGETGKAFHFNATDCPDLFPPLVALASGCSGITVIEGVSRLTHKESNRGLALQEEFGKMGVAIRLQGDLMMIEGTPAIRGAAMRSHQDHRIAMAVAVAALNAVGATTITDAEAVDKSYPRFYRDLILLHADVSLPSNL